MAGNVTERNPGANRVRTAEAFLEDRRQINDLSVELDALLVQFRLGVMPSLRSHTEAIHFAHIVEIADGWLTRNSNPRVQTVGEDPVLMDALNPILVLDEKAIIGNEEQKSPQLREQIEAWAKSALSRITQARRSGAFTQQRINNRNTFLPLEEEINSLAQTLLHHPHFSRLRHTLAGMGLERVQMPTLDFVTHVRRSLAVGKDIALSLPDLKVLVARRWLAEQVRAGYTTTPEHEAVINEVREQGKDGLVAGTVFMGGVGSGKTKLGIHLIELDGRQTGVISCHPDMGQAELLGEPPVTVSETIDDTSNLIRMRNRVAAMDPEVWFQSIRDVVTHLSQRGQELTIKEFLAPYCFFDPGKTPSSAVDWQNAYLRMLNFRITASDFAISIEENGIPRREKIGIEGSWVMGQILNYWNRGVQPFLDELEKAGPRSLHGLYYLMGLRQGQTINIGGFSFTIPTWAKIHASSNLTDTSELEDHQLPLFDRMKRRVLPDLPSVESLLLMGATWVSDEQGNTLLDREEQIQYIHAILTALPILKQAHKDGHMIQPFTLRGVEEMCRRLVQVQHGMPRRSGHSVLDALRHALSVRPYLSKEDEENPNNPLYQALKNAIVPGMTSSSQRAFDWSILKPDRLIKDDVPQVAGTMSRKWKEVYLPIPLEELFVQDDSGKRPMNIDEYNMWAAKRMLRLQERGKHLARVFTEPLLQVVASTLDADVADKGEPTQVYTVYDKDTGRGCIDSSLVAAAVRHVLTQRNQARHGSLNLPLGQRIDIARERGKTDFNLRFGYVASGTSGEASSIVLTKTVPSQDLGFKTDSQFDITRDTSIGPIAATSDGKTVVFEIYKRGSTSQFIIVNNPFSDGKPSIQMLPTQDTPTFLGMVENGSHLYFLEKSDKGTSRMIRYVRKDKDENFARHEQTQPIPIDDATVVNGGTIVVIASGDELTFYDESHPDIVIKARRVVPEKGKTLSLIPVGKHTVIEAAIETVDGQMQVDVRRVHFVST